MPSGILCFSQVITIIMCLSYRTALSSANACDGKNCEARKFYVTRSHFDSHDNSISFSTFQRVLVHCMQFNATRLLHIVYNANSSTHLASARLKAYYVLLRGLNGKYVRTYEIIYDLKRNENAVLYLYRTATMTMMKWKKLFIFSHE